jgi:hypothetical protein
MVVHAYNPSTRNAETRGYEFEATLRYIASSKQTQTIGDSVSEPTAKLKSLLPILPK